MNDPDLPEFIGFHCQEHPRGRADDIIGAVYAADHFIHILEHLPFDMRDQAIEQGLLPDTPPDQYDDEFDAWADEVEDFLYKNGIRWIYVSKTGTLEDYGDYCYYTFLDPDHPGVYYVGDDVGVNDWAEFFVYDVNKVQPILIEVED